jgi:hypothetical protein
MPQIVSREGQRFVIRPRADYNTAGRWIAGIGLLLAVLLAPVPVLADEKGLWTLQALPGILIVLGLIFAAVGRKWVLDPGARSLSHGADRWSYDDFGAVMATTYIKRVHTQHGTQQHQEFAVLLVVRQQAQEVMATIDQLEARLQELIDRPEAEPDEALQQEVAESLGRMQEALVGGTMPVFRHADELAVWQATETLAKQLQVPVLDFCGDAMALRPPSELDLSLCERLRRGLEKVGAEPESPLGVERRAERERLVLEFDKPKMLPWWVITGVPLALFGLGIWAVIEDSPGLGALGMLAAFGALFFLLFFKNGHRRCRLEVDDEALRYSEEGKRKQRRMPLDALETLRVNTTLHTSLNWMSDEQLVRIPMDAQTACWLKHCVTARLAERSLRLL